MGSERLIRSAIEYEEKRKSVTLVHNIMKYTEGSFRNWGYALAEKEFGKFVYTWERWEKTKEAHNSLIKNKKRSAFNSIADITLQQVMTQEFDVIATLNLNGDYLSDALAAQVGGIGIAPNYLHAVFEATHGTAPAALDKVNPGSVIMSGEMMLHYMGWSEAADLKE